MWLFVCSHHYHDYIELLWLHGCHWSAGHQTRSDSCVTGSEFRYIAVWYLESIFATLLKILYVYILFPLYSCEILNGCKCPEWYCHFIDTTFRLPCCVVWNQCLCILNECGTYIGSRHGIVCYNSHCLFIHIGLVYWCIISIFHTCSSATHQKCNIRGTQGGASAARTLTFKHLAIFFS